MILDRSTENIKEIVWSDINAVLNEIADYYLKIFENPNNIRESLLRQFEGAVTNELSGINLEDYLRTNNCSLELVAKYNKLLKIKSDFYGGFIVYNKSSEIIPEKKTEIIIDESKEDDIDEQEDIDEVIEEEVTPKEEVVKENNINDNKTQEHKPANIEGYIKVLDEAIKERDKVSSKEVVQATLDPNATMEEIEEDYSVITELLGDEDIIIKFKESE